MPAARYWRVVGISTYGGGDLELSDIALYSGGTRVDGSATFTSTFAPISAGRWASADVRQPGFALQWDFGVAQDVDDVQFTPTTLPLAPTKFEIHYSSDAASWVTFSGYTGTYSGAPLSLQEPEPHYPFVELLTAQNGGTREQLQRRSQALFSNSSGFFSEQSNAFTSGPFGPTYFIVGRAPNGFSGACNILWEKSVTLDGDFTFEFHRYESNSSQDTPARDFFYFAGTELRIEVASRAVSLKTAGGVTLMSSPSGLISWHHFRLVRSSGTLNFFRNGVSFGTAGYADVLNLTGIGSNAVVNSDNRFYGVRLTKGLARSTANFTPPTAEYPSQTNPVRLLSGGLLTRISEYTPPATVTSQIAPAPNRIDIAYGGTATVTGTVKRKADPANVPLRRRVRLYDENGRQFIREVWSDAVTGAFVFENLNPAYAYTVVTYDYENNYRALTVDRVVAV